MTDRQRTEWAVAYYVNDEQFIYEADEDEVRAVAEGLGGRVLVRKVFRTSWLDDPRDR